MKCTACQRELTVGVFQSAAGWYIGTVCPGCGPHSRESGYYPDRASAEVALRGLDNF